MLKRIALHVEKDQACAGRTLTALALAQRFEAELLAIYVNYTWAHYPYGESVIPSAAYEVMLQQLAQEHDKCHMEFERCVADTGIATQWRNPGGRPDETLPLHARCADLLVLSQAHERDTDSIVDPYMVENVIMNAGRPVLVVPYAGEYTRIGSRILVCWDGGREAARALADAAPFLASAEEVLVLTLDADSDAMRSRETVPGDLQAWFRAQGYGDPRMLTRETAELGHGNAILNAASDHSCDLIVMGLYGHSRMREWVLGGASRDMLNAMTVPVLFSH
ncbi:UspA domain-containing protein [Bordetella sputigena]|uniref:universal stress protein n=1 Tax=Bordetella sputigena TaxID=1416810 RepID=UPI0039F0ABE2